MFFVLASSAHDEENSAFANSNSSEELKSNEEKTEIKPEDELESEINKVIDDENKSSDKEVKESSNDDVQINSEESNDNNGTNISEKTPRQNIKKITCLPNKGANTTTVFWHFVLYSVFLFVCFFLNNSILFFRSMKKTKL